MLSFFPLDVLCENWDVIESVSEGFLTYYSYMVFEGLKASLFHLISGHNVTTGRNKRMDIKGRKMQLQREILNILELATVKTTKSLRDIDPFRNSNDSTNYNLAFHL